MTAEPSNASPTGDLANAPQPLWRKLLPFALALVLVAFVGSRLDLAAFLAELARVDYPLYAAFAVAFVLALLSADTVATVFIYRRTKIADVRLLDFFVVRGASYLPSLLNHHVGQVFLTFVMSRAYGVRVLRVAGATLLTYATWMGCVLGMATLALLASGQDARWTALPLGAGVVYLAVLAWRPPALARVRALTPLFDAGISGHLAALAVRVPHFAVLFFGSWIPFWFFGVHIPLTTAMIYIPIVMVAVTLPITPQGVGTRDVLAATFFEAFAAGATREQRFASIAAATASWAVATTVVEALLGLFLMHRALPRIAPGALAASVEIPLSGGAPAPGDT